MGHSVSEKTRRKCSEANKGKRYSPTTEFKKGDHPSPETEFKKGNHPKSEFKLGHKESEETRLNRVRASAKGARVTPNKPERQLDIFLQELLHGEYIINVTGETMILGGKIPDFVNINGQKKVIELFGDWWHSDKKIQLTGRGDSEESRKEFFKQLGWDTLVIWEHELKNESLLKEKILEFDK